MQIDANDADRSIYYINHISKYILKKFNYTSMLSDTFHISQIYIRVTSVQVDKWTSVQVDV